MRHLRNALEELATRTIGTLTEEEVLAEAKALIPRTGEPSADRRLALLFSEYDKRRKARG